MHKAYVFPDVAIDIDPSDESADAPPPRSQDSSDPTIQRLLWHATWLLDGPTPDELAYDIRSAGGGPHLYNSATLYMGNFGFHRIGNDNTVSAPKKGWHAYDAGVAIGPFSLNRSFAKDTANVPGPLYDPAPQDIVSNVWVVKDDDDVLQIWHMPDREIKTDDVVLERDNTVTIDTDIDTDGFFAEE